MKAIFTYLIIIVSIQYSNQISSQIVFKTYSQEIGTIQSNGDIQKINYTFKNNSKHPTAITRIASNCGCTTPSFDKRPIQTGEQRTIQVSFNPIGIKGYFKKQITVYFADSKNPVHLYLSGNVIAPENLIDGYHYVLGKLQLKNIRATLQASEGQTFMRTFPLINATAQPVKVTLSSDIEGILFEEAQITLAGHETYELPIYFSPKKSQLVSIRIIEKKTINNEVALKVIKDK